MNLDEIIRNKITENNNFIGFDEFMSMALYHPGKGYYSNGSKKFGRDGDFITAPETSDLFGFCIAKQCKQILDSFPYILEFGAGNGTLACQILFYLAKHNQLPKYYYIVELSADLKDRQRKLIEKVLPEVLDRIIWLNELPNEFEGVVIANEVIDAIPAKRIKKMGGKFHEQGVCIKDDSLEYAFSSLNINLDDYSIPDSLEEGYTTEVNIQARGWIHSVYSMMKRGVVLIIDYGMDRDTFYHPQRVEGTLRCYSQHKATENPFENIGTQDITTSVNFSDLADASKEAGFNIEGYCTQAMFLISLGIQEFLSEEKDSDQKISYAQEIKQLILPSTMGESFKVLALKKDFHGALVCFKEQNLIDKIL